MSTFTGQKIANTYKQLLQVNTSNSDLSTTLITVETGAGNATPLQLATDKVNINGTFQLGGETLTANVSALNNIADLSGITGIVVGDSGSLSGRTLVGGSPITITNANGTAGNPTISLATTGITSATYGPLARLNIDTYGRVINKSIQIRTLAGRGRYERRREERDPGLPDRGQTAAPPDDPLAVQQPGDFPPGTHLQCL